MRYFQNSVIVLFLAMTAFSAAADSLSLFNLAADKVPALTDAAKTCNLTVKPGDMTAKAFDGSLAVWQATAGGGAEINADTAKALGEYVRGGGSLLLSFSPTPGSGPLRLAFMLPTTAWHTQGGQSLDAMKHSGSVAVAQTDERLFPGTTVKGLSLPFYFPIRPFDAVERGEARYERFARNIFYIDQTVPAGNTFWSRPLLNRDWQIRARGDDGAQTPLLLTGRYGAGRVAVLASSLDGLPDAPAARALLTPLIQWLVARDAAKSPAPANLPAPDWSMDATAGLLHVTLKNPANVALPVRVLARVATWEHALVGDAEATTSLPAGGTATVDLPLPKPSALGYQALDYQNVLDVRLGVLSGDGAALLTESRRLLDPRPTLSVAVDTDNMRALAYPFKAPGSAFPGFQARLGMALNSYAYPPGAAINADVTLGNGVHNIAPLAVPRDETKADNPTTTGLNDEAGQADVNPNPDKIIAYGVWAGQVGEDNTIGFTFPAAVTVSGVTLVGTPDDYRKYLGHNPGAAVISLDGAQLARVDGLDQRFVDEAGQVRISFAPANGRELRVTLPWIPTLGNTPRKRGTPWLAEVRIDGSTAKLPAVVQGKVELVLRDSLSGAVVPLESRAVTLAPGAVQTLRFKCTAPAGGPAPRFYTLEAGFGGQTGKTPLTVLQPAHPLQPLGDLKPPTIPDLGFIVTRGFRNVMDIGTGTDEIPPGWATPDDLIWAYSHQMKQLGANSRTQANRLYVTESDMRHYSTPWRDFPDGIYFYSWAPQLLIERMKRDPRWKDSDRASLSHSDRWDCAPDVDSLHGWQDFIAFDDYLRSQKLPGLQGRTRSELASEIHAKFESRWQIFQLERYVGGVHNLRAAFAKEGKQLIISAQGCPVVPAKYEADLTATIRGQSDDPTWGMIEENGPLSVGRQMGILAFNPGWAMATPIQWGWDSAVLGNPHWHNPVGTTESSRRLQYDRAWRGTIGWDGKYKSIHTYGYSANGGFSYTMTPNDWQQWWRVEERMSLLGPEAPLGAGVITNSSRFADPEHAAWSGAGGWGKSAADDQVRSVERAVRGLQESGIAAPFAANAGTLGNWKENSPLVLLDLCNFSADEVADLRQLRTRGVRLAASKGSGALSAAAAALFGVNPDGSPAVGQKVLDLNGHAVVAGTGTLMVAAAMDDIAVQDYRTLAPLMQVALQMPLQFSAGCQGYGFVCQGKKFVVLEDWKEEGRVATLRVRAGTAANSAHAVDTNDHTTLVVRRDGPDWVIEVPMRPGDGALVCVEESE